MANIINKDIQNLIHNSRPGIKATIAKKMLKYCIIDRVDTVAECHYMLGRKYRKFSSLVFIKAIEAKSCECISFFLEQDLKFSILDNAALQMAIIENDVWVVEKLLCNKKVRRKITNEMLHDFFKENKAYRRFISCKRAQKCINIETIKFYISSESYKSIKAVEIRMEPVDD